MMNRLLLGFSGRVVAPPVQRPQQQQQRPRHRRTALPQSLRDSCGRWPKSPSKGASASSPYRRPLVAPSAQPAGTFELGPVLDAALSDAGGGQSVQERVVLRLATALREGVPPRELADGAKRFVDQLQLHHHCCTLEELANELLDHAESGMAAVGLELWHALHVSNKQAASVVSNKQRDAETLAMPKVVSLAERHSDDWALKSLVFSQRTFKRILHRAPHNLLKTYFEGFIDACRESARQSGLRGLCIDLLTQLCDIYQDTTRYGYKVDLHAVRVAVHQRIVHATLEVMENSTDDELLTSAMHLFYMNGWAAHQVDGPFGLSGRAGARFPGEVQVDLILNRLYKALERHVQIYESGVVVSLFRQCARVVVSSDRWRQRVAQLPFDVQARLCDEVTSDPEMEARLKTSWVMSLEPFKQKTLSLRSGAARLNRREAARWCLNLLASKWTTEEESAMESRVSSLIRPEQPMCLREAGVYLMGVVMEPNDISVLLSTLSDPSPQVRYTACLAVGAHAKILKQQDTVERISFSYRSISSSAATATAKAAPGILKEAHASLLRILGDSTERGVQHAAAKALKSLLPPVGGSEAQDPASLELAERVADVCARVIQDQMTADSGPLLSVVKLFVQKGLNDGCAIKAFHKEMVTPEDDEKLEEISTDHVARYLPLAISAISGPSYGLALPRFFLFVHRVMHVLSGELKTLVLEKCVRLLRMARTIMADASSASNMDDMLSTQAALLLVISKSEPSWLPPSISPDDLVALLHELIKERVRQGSQSSAANDNLAMACMACYTRLAPRFPVLERHFAEHHELVFQLFSVSFNGTWEANMYARYFAEYLANNSREVIAPHVVQLLDTIHASWEAKPYVGFNILIIIGVLAVRFVEETCDFVESKLQPHLIREHKLHDCPAPLLLIGAAHAQAIVSSGLMDARLAVAAVSMLPMMVRASAWGPLDRSHYADAAVAGGVKLIRLLLDAAGTAPAIESPACPAVSGSTTEASVPASTSSNQAKVSPLLLEALIRLAKPPARLGRDTQAEDQALQAATGEANDTDKAVADEGDAGVPIEFARLRSRRSRAERRADMTSLARRLIRLLPPPPPLAPVLTAAPGEHEGTNRESVEADIIGTSDDDNDVEHWRAALSASLAHS